MDAPGLGNFNKVETASYEVVGVIADERLTPFDASADRCSHPDRTVGIDDRGRPPQLQATGRKTRSPEA
jgi:hypothetical protein